MASFNKVVVMGNLTRDPELRTVGGGTSVCEVSLAINRTWFDKGSQEKKEEVSFIDVVMWGRTAEICNEYLKKGRSLLVEGRLQQDRWEDKETGQNRSKVRVVCEKMTMLGGQEQTGGGGGGGYESKPNAQAVSAPPASSQPSPDDIPF